MARARRGRGEGSVYQRKSDNRWVASVSRTSGGERRRLVAYGDTKREAMDGLKDLLNREAAPDKATVESLVNRWLSAKESSLEGSTYTRYKLTADSHIVPFIGGMRLTAIKPWDVEQFYADHRKKGVSADSSHKAGSLLRQILGYAVIPLRLIEHNPALEVPLPKVDREEIVVWQPDEVTRFLETAATDWMHAFYVTALATGMRVGELLGLEWQDVDFAGQYLTVRRMVAEFAGKIQVKKPKTRSGLRRIDLPEVCVSALHERQKCQVADGNATAPVFSTRKGTYWRRSNLRSRSFVPLVEAAGVQLIKMHDMRHTHATMLLAAGVSPKVVSERLGHASVEITLDTYSHILPTIQKEAAQRVQSMLA